MCTVTCEKYGCNLKIASCCGIRCCSVDTYLFNKARGVFSFLQSLHQVTCIAVACPECQQPIKRPALGSPDTRRLPSSRGSMPANYPNAKSYGTPVSLHSRWCSQAEASATFHLCERQVRALAFQRGADWQSALPLIGPADPEGPPRHRCSKKNLGRPVPAAPSRTTGRLLPCCRSALTQAQSLEGARVTTPDVSATLRHSDLYIWPVPLVARHRCV